MEPKTATTATQAGKLFDRYEYGGHRGNVPLPERGMSGEALTAWYLNVLGWYRDRVQHRDEPRPEGHENCTDCSRRRYNFKCEAKDAEFALRILHTCAAPDAPYVCDESCPHIRQGMSPQQVKAWLDDALAGIADSQAYVSKHIEAEWARNELYDAQSRLAGFLKRLDQPEYAKLIENLVWKPG